MLKYCIKQLTNLRNIEQEVETYDLMITFYFTSSLFTVNPILCIKIFPSVQSG